MSREEEDFSLLLLLLHIYIYNAGNVRPPLFFSFSLVWILRLFPRPPSLSLSLSFRAATRMDAAGRWCGGPYSLVSPPLFYTPHVLSCLYRYLFPVGVFCTPSSRRGVFRASDAFFFLVISPKREVVCKFPKMTTQYITDKGEGGSSFTPTAALRKIALCLTALSFVTKQPARPAAVHFPFIPLKKKKSEKMMISILYTISRYRFDAS